MLILESLMMKGFRSFKQETNLKFPESGAILIRGKWKNRDISSGSGKSSIVLAIAYALGYCGIPSTELKNRTSKSMCVDLVIKNTKTGDVYKIIRSPKLVLEINGVKYSDETAKNEEKIKELIKIPLDLAKILTYREQRSKGTFITATDSKKKDFLSTVLQLQEIENAIDSIKEDISTEKSTVSRLEGAISSYELMQLDDITILNETITLAKSKLAEATERLNKALETATDRDSLMEERNKIQLEIKRINDLSFQKQIKEQKNQQIKLSLVRCKSEHDTMKAGTCPTCSQGWVPDPSKLTEKVNDMNALIAEMKTNIEFVKNSVPVIESKQQLENISNELNSKIILAAQDSQQYQSLVQEAKRNLELLISQKDKHLTVVTSLERYKTELEGMLKKLNISEASMKLLGKDGFLGSIFDEVLIEIENKTNAMINTVPNIESFTVKFPSTKTTQAGSVQNKIVTEIYHDNSKVSLKSLSGGQSCGLELFSDLAAADTIRGRSGSPLGWISLDEAMDGLDTGTKEYALDVIKKFIKGQIFVIDHSTEVKEGFGSVIEVEYDGRESYVITG